MNQGPALHRLASRLHGRGRATIHARLREAIAAGELTPGPRMAVGAFVQAVGKRLHGQPHRAVLARLRAALSDVARRSQA